MNRTEANEVQKLWAKATRVQQNPRLRHPNDNCISPEMVKPQMDKRAYAQPYAFLYNIPVLKISHKYSRNYLACNNADLAVSCQRRTTANFCVYCREGDVVPTYFNIDYWQ